MSERALHRIFLVEPERLNRDSRGDLEVDALIEQVALGLHALGITARRHISGTHFEGARADLAIWFPDHKGTLARPQKREVLSNAHVGFAVCPPKDDAAFHYDALFAAHEVLVDPIKNALGDSVEHRPPVIPVRLPLRKSDENRDAQKRARGVSTSPAVLLDLRNTSAANIDRVFFQLALSHHTTFIVLADDDQNAHKRIQNAAKKHQVAAYLTSGEAAYTDAINAVDVLLGAPTWAELFLAASHELLVLTRAEDTNLGALFNSLRAARALDAPVSLLRLSAELDAATTDSARLSARGMMLRANLCGDAPAFLEACKSVRPRTQAKRPLSAWVPLLDADVQKAQAKSPSEKERDRQNSIEETLARMKREMNAASPTTISTTTTGES